MHRSIIRAGVVTVALVGALSAHAGENCPADGDCLKPHDTPGCDCEFCCDVVCDLDPTCCTDAWDAMCVDLAFNQLCDKACLSFPNCPAEGDCCAVHASPGCDDEGCCYFVCFTDPSCCNAGWDQSCVDLADQICNGCPPPGPDADLDGDGDVDGADLGLLLGAWGPCQPANDRAGGLCPGAGGECCAANGTPGCDDVDCCTFVCELDPFCCNTSWDALCAGLALDECAVCDPCPADLDGDGEVGGADLGLLLGSWSG